MNIIKVKVTREQFNAIRVITADWDGNARWLPDLTKYLWEQDIRPNADADPAWPGSYDFLAGGVDHVDETRDSITIHDRCLQRSAGTEDGTTQFVVARRGAPVRR